MITALSQDKTKASIDGVELRLHRQIEYRIPNTNKISQGKIEELRMIDAGGMDSVWANVIDIGTAESEWISLKNWKELYDLGALAVTKEEEVEDLPF